MKRNVRRGILWAGIAWGGLLLVIGFFASFSIGANDNVVGFYATGSMVDVLRVLSRVYLWFHILFGLLFMALAKQEANHAKSAI